MAPVNPIYLPKDTTPQSSLLSTLTVLRQTDLQSFVAAQIPKTLVTDPQPLWRDPSVAQVTTPLAPVVINAAGIAISRILNHPNIVSLVDTVQNSQIPGYHVPAAIKRFGEEESPTDFSVWEDMNAGTLSLILPSPNYLPDPSDAAGWHALAKQNYNRQALPEGLCWHVLLSISKALLWLHWGVKETEGIEGDYQKHDDDWQSILIRDISPGQIWFKQPKGGESYGECKLGGFHWAKVTGCPGARVAIAVRKEEASVEKKYFWAPEITKNTHAWGRPSEIWSLGAVIYCMMTGMPPPKYYAYDWWVSRMGDQGYSKYLQDLVGRMLETDMAKRPDTLELVDVSMDAWKAWRSNTTEGQQYVDLADERAKFRYKGSQFGAGNSGMLV